MSIDDLYYFVHLKSNCSLFPVGQPDMGSRVEWRCISKELGGTTIAVIIDMYGLNTPYHSQWGI